VRDLARRGEIRGQARLHLNNCRSRSMSEMRAMGTSKTRASFAVLRSKTGSASVSKQVQRADALLLVRRNRCGGLSSVSGEASFAICTSASASAVTTPSAPESCRPLAASSAKRNFMQCLADAPA